MVDRRSSGRRFEKPREATRLSLLGVLVCIAMIPFTVIAQRHRDTLGTVARAGVVRLPDSSTVVLASGARVRYDRDFASRRVLWLFGSARFDVVPGSPFVVWTETAVARTNRASFAVTAASQESTFVLVHTGTVQLRALNEDNDGAYRAVSIGAGSRALALRVVGARLIPP